MSSAFDTESSRKPLATILRDLTWGLSLSFYETLLLGDRWWWWRMHSHLRRAYQGWSPKQVLAGLPEAERLDTLMYGEAPASTVRRILRVCRQHFPDARTLADLGAGRGILAMTAAQHDWEVLAIEYLRDFCERSRPVTEALGYDVKWVQADFLTLPLPCTQIIHTSATAYPEEFRLKLAEKLKTEALKGQGILTQDWVLDDPRFKVLASEPMPVTWGTALFTLHLVD